MVQLSNAASAESMPAVNQDPRDSFSYVILEAAEQANIELPRLIVQVHDVGIHRSFRECKISTRGIYQLYIIIITPRF